LGDRFGAAQADCEGEAQPYAEVFGGGDREEGPGEPSGKDDGKEPETAAPKLRLPGQFRHFLKTAGVKSPAPSHNMLHEEFYDYRGSGGCNIATFHSQSAA